LVLTPVGMDQINGSFTAAAPAASGYIVVRYPHNATPTVPANGTAYTAGNSLGSGTVVSVGATTTFSATGLSTTTQYDFYIYSFTTGSCATVYRPNNPLVGVATTLAPLPPSCAT